MLSRVLYATPGVTYGTRVWWLQHCRRCMRGYLCCCSLCCCRWCYIGHDHRPKLDDRGREMGEEELLATKVAVLRIPFPYCRRHDSKGVPGYTCFCCCRDRWRRDQERMHQRGACTCASLWELALRTVTPWHLTTLLVWRSHSDRQPRTCQPPVDAQV